MDNRKPSTIYMKTLMEKRKRTIKTHNLFQSSTTLTTNYSDSLTPLSKMASDITNVNKSNRGVTVFDSNANLFNKDASSLSILPISSGLSGNHLEDSSPLSNTIDLSFQNLPNCVPDVDQDKMKNEDVIFKRSSLPVVSLNLKSPLSKMEPLPIGIKPPLPRKSMISSLMSDSNNIIRRISVAPPSYQDLVRKTSLVKNSLIAYSVADNSGENSATTKKISYAQKISSATQIQSLVRRYLLLQKYVKYEKKRTEQRYLIMKQSLMDSENFLILYQNNDKNHNLVQYYMQIASKELDSIINQIKNRKISDVQRSDLLIFIYNLCDNTKYGSITRSQFRQLVLYIFRFSVAKSTLNKDLNEIDPQYRNSIPLTDYISYMNKYVKSRSVLGFVQQKTSCYNVKKSLLYKEIVKEILKMKCKKLFSKINLDVFDKKNPPLFVCSECKKHFVYPHDLIKHVVICKKKNQII